MTDLITLNTAASSRLCLIILMREETQLSSDVLGFVLSYLKRQQLVFASQQSGHHPPSREEIQSPNADSSTQPWWVQTEGKDSPVDRPRLQVRSNCAVYSLIQWSAGACSAVCPGSEEE